MARRPRGGEQNGTGPGAPAAVVLYVDPLGALVIARGACDDAGLVDGAGDSRGGRAGAREDGGDGHAHVGTVQVCAYAVAHR